jgi:mono/diheme cytochrome c family protein
MLTHKVSALFLLQKKSGKFLSCIFFLCFFSYYSFSQTQVKTSIVRGKLLYKQHCLSCHQADGSGVPRLTPPLARTQHVLGDAGRLIKIVLNGLNEEIEVNGDYYSNPMPPFAAVLKDQEIADVLSYIRSNFGNKVAPVKAASVTLQRKK